MKLTRKARFFFALAAVLGLHGMAALAQPQAPVPAKALPSAAPSKKDLRRARQAYERGVKAEQAQDWPGALQAYSEASRLDPRDKETLLRRELARFQIVQQHTDRAERQAIAGRFDHAREELRAALALDPGYTVARERLAQLTSAPPQAPPRVAPALRPPDAQPAGPVQLAPPAGTRDFNHRGNTRSAYEEVARQFGVVASFEAELPSRQVRLRVQGVDFSTAMTLVASQTKTFWRPVDARTFFVAEDTPAKRHDYAPTVVRTVILPASTTPDKLTEAMRLVREIAGVTHADLDTRTRSLTLRDTPQNVAVALALLEEIEQARPELLLDIEILEVNRNRSRKLGVTPPTTEQLITLSTSDIRAIQNAQNISALLAIAQRIFGTSIPNLVAFGGGRTTFLATLPGASATFAKTLSMVRSGRRVLLRAQDGQPATFFVGERFPVALALLGASLAPGVLNPGSSGQLPFPRADFPTGADPVAVATASFRNNGILDLAVVNKKDNSVSILLGMGDGTFGAKTDFRTETGPVAIAVANFTSDLDRNLDLAVANQTEGTVSIFTGNGLGTFSPKPALLIILGPNTNPSALVAGDFNGDGKPDLAVVNQGTKLKSSSVSIFLGNGDGTFKPAPNSPVAVGATPVSIAAADLNNDGRLDLVVANHGSDDLTILRGNKDGSFSVARGSPVAVGKNPSAVAVGDFNHDKIPDLAVTNQTDNTLSILLGNGDGTFKSAPSSPDTVGTTPVALVAEDFNLDGRLDVAVVNQGSNTFSILLGNGDGSFGLRAEIATGNKPSALINADFNRDSLPDLAITNQGDKTVSVILNTPTFTTSPGGIPQTAYPGAEYEDIGLKVRTTPRIHNNDEVTLQLEFELRSLSGAAVNGIPIISNRTVQQTVRLHENEPAMLSGMVSQEGTRAITGTPGFARLPGIGYLAGPRNTEARETELLIIVTPRALRLASRKDRSIYAGRGEGAPRPGLP